MRSCYIIALVVALSSPRGGAEGLRAQNTNNSPYSSYGFGDLVNSTQVSQAMMAGVSAAVIDPYSVIQVNPASYASLVRPTFESGAVVRYVNYSTATASEDQSAFRMLGLTLGVPFGKGRWGMALGLMPVSDVGYSLSERVPLESGEGDVRFVYEGSGGLNRAFIGVGTSVWQRYDSLGNGHKLALGANFNYLFGGIEQTRKDRTLAEREFKTFSEALEKETVKLRQQDEQAKGRMQEVEQRLLKLTAEAEKAETQRQRIAAEVESLQDRREEFAQAEAQLKKWNEIEKRLRGQLEELEEKHDMLRRGLPTEEATVVMFANDIIKRIDLIDALIQRYGTVNGSDAHDQLQTLRASFEDILHQHGIVEFDVPSGTEVDVDLRKRIAVVDSVPGKAKPRVTESFRSGFIYSREDGHEIILRKVEVRTSSQ